MHNDRQTQFAGNSQFLSKEFFLCRLSRKIIVKVQPHLAKGDKSVFLDDLEAGLSKGAKEKGADRFAAELLIPANEWQTSSARHDPTVSNIRNLAVRRHVHPAIIAGRVRYERKNYKMLSQMVGSRTVRRQFPAYKSGDIAL